MTPRRLLAAALLPFAATAACRAPGPQEGARIEVEIKAPLVAEQAVNLTRLGVVSDDGRAYRSGTVSTVEQRVRAERLARSVRASAGS